MDIRNNEKDGILNKYVWRENNILFCKDFMGEIYRFARNFENPTGNTKKRLFRRVNNPNGLYERKIKRVKLGTRLPAKMSFSDNFTAKQWKSNKTKNLYETIGYHFTLFPPRKKTTRSKIDELPFLERFTHSNYRNMLLADIKVLFDLQKESFVVESKLMNAIQECYNENLVSASEIGEFLSIAKNIMEKAKTPKGKKYFQFHEEEGVKLVSRN